MKSNFSSMTFNCLTNPSPIVSLDLKEPIVTWWSFQFTNRKFMTKANISYYPLFIHKSNVIVLVNVASRWGSRYKSNYEESWLKGFFLTLSFVKGKQNFAIKLQNQHMHPYIFTSVWGEKPWTTNNTKSSKKTLHESHLVSCKEFCVKK
jgi:hypothetical protein